MLVVGLTGGIGSGKSTVAKLFEDLGVTVIDTDQLAREVTKPDTIGFSEIVEKFGHDILTAQNTLDRNKLRKIIFVDDDARAWLENLLHPLIREQLAKQILAAQSEYCIAVIPLLIETGPNPYVNRILVVDTPKDQQIDRAATRDNQSNTEINAILSKQVTREHRLRIADDVISNVGTKEDLIGQVNAFHKYYLSLAARLDKLL